MEDSPCTRSDDLNTLRESNMSDWDIPYLHIYNIYKWAYKFDEKIDQWWDSKALGQCLSVQHRHQRSAVARQGARRQESEDDKLWELCDLGYWGL